MASMANRCYWLSTAEIAVYLLTGGDTIKSHQFQRVFTRELQWIVHEAKRILKGLPPTGEQDPAGTSTAITATNVRLEMPADTKEMDEQNDEEPELDAEVVDSTLETTSTNFADDFAHRGQRLQSMPLYVYSMHVQQFLRTGASRLARNHMRYFSLKHIIC